MSPAQSPVATIQELHGPTGRAWQLTTTCAGFADHAWLERDRLLALSDGAASLEIVYQPRGGDPVKKVYQPKLPGSRR